jgi:hypothetical protein
MAVSVTMYWGLVSIWTKMDYSTYHHVIAGETSAQFYILRLQNMSSSQQLQTSRLL